MLALCDRFYSFVLALFDDARFRDDASWLLLNVITCGVFDWTVLIDNTLFKRLMFLPISAACEIVQELCKHTFQLNLDNFKCAAEPFFSWVCTELSDVQSQSCMLECLYQLFRVDKRF
jgi:hypothetical protein